LLSDEWLEDLRERLEERPEELDVVLREAVDEVTRRLDADRGTLYLVDRASRKLVSRMADLPEIAEIRLRIGEGIAGQVARTGRLMRVRKGEQDPRVARHIDERTGYHTDGMLVAPVNDGAGSVIAVLQVLNKRRGDFGDHDVRMIERLAADLGDLLMVTSLRHQLSSRAGQPLSFRFNHIIGDSPAMQDVYERTARAARTDVTVLLRGESGSGKELFAQAIHYNSDRREEPFVKVDCAALPETLIENELFGHEKGAYTSAEGEAEGKVEAAKGGTLFLDEVGEVSLSVQVKLLRLLQEKMYTRVGGTRPRRADVRFVCATNRDLEQAVAAGTFRQDLYYRVRVVEIVVPPLRERGPGDLTRLVEHFLADARERYERPLLELAPSAIRAMHAHDWPGNVRELKNCLESAVVLAPDTAIEARHLPITSAFPHLVPPEREEELGSEPFVTGLRPLREVEREYVLHVLDALDGNRSAAARLLGIGRNTLLRKIRYGKE